MGLSDMFKQAEEAQDVLDETLTQEDRTALQDIYRDLGSQILWGKVLDNAFPLLLGLAEELIETEGMSKDGGPWYMVGEDEMALFADEDNKSMSRKHLLLLLLAKKLLGGLKTRVNQSMKDISVLSENDEAKLAAVVDRAAEVSQGLQKEAMDREIEESLEEEDSVSSRDVVAEVDISPAGGGCLDGRHPRTIVRWIRIDGDMHQQTYCRDCRRVVEKVRGRNQKKDAKECTHVHAEWVPGQEGSNARCTECGNPIQNPETFEWSDVGLEPFGDDPSQDEAITLCSDY